MKQIQTKFYKSSRTTGLAQLTAGLFLLLFFASNISAQVATIKLSTTDATSYFDVTDNGDNSKLRMRADGRLGINQDTPTAGLHLVSDDGLLVQGTYNSGNTWTLGAGTRMHWYSIWGAFRAGRVTGTQWDDTNVGLYSFAVGLNTTASGSRSVAMGASTIASGEYSTAMGYFTTASGSHSVAMGASTTASGNFSTAMGQSATASGLRSTAMGTWVSTNFLSGSFIIGDNSTGGSVTNSSVADQMTMRFNGGYRFYSNTALTTGVYMNSGVGGWTNYSDRNKKENFRAIDGELLLEKVSALPITEWNYKGTDKSVRYIGPMAQDFYAAFHLGGTDSLGINSIAIDGVNMAAIQALKKRTDELKTQNTELSIQNAELRRAIEELEMKNGRIKELEFELAFQNNLVNQLMTEFKSVKNAVTKLKKEKINNSLKIASLTNEEN